tara:strand:- start:665 stop:988 length:324 start_codon:yes stop_codon:yes gene_type:complete
LRNIPPSKYLIISRENVENVVNEPKRPTTNKDFHKSESINFSEINTYKKPIKKAPITFTIKVGRTRILYLFNKYMPEIYLVIAPKKPPKPTNKIFKKVFVMKKPSSY